jgi:tectonic-1/3
MTIEAATADIVLAIPVELKIGRVLSQTFSAKFVQLGSVAPVHKSGNPGYIRGMPLLAGILSGTAGAIDYNPEYYLGLSLIKEKVSPGSRLIECTNLEEDYGSRVVVKFGENIVSGCTLNLRKSDFEDCAALRLRVFKLQTLTASKLTHYGTFGNASVNNQYDWIKAIQDPNSAVTGTVVQTDTLTTCANLLTNFDIEILYAKLGAATNPQSAIVGVRYKYTPGTFGWICDTPSDCVDPALYSGGAENTANIGLTAKPYKLRSSVTFAKVSENVAKLYVPPAPRLINPIPNDIWYPFNIPV